MAATTDMAPNRAPTRPPRTRRAANGSAARAQPRRAAAQPAATILSEQVSSCRTTSSRSPRRWPLAEDKVNEAQSMAKREVKNLAKTGQHAVEDVQDEFGQLEKQIKDTIREKPLTAVAGAIALGFILAVVSR